MNEGASLVGILFLLLVLALIALGFLVRVVIRQARALGRQKEVVDSEGKKRVEKSRSVLLGQVAEHFAPLLPGFGFNPKDARFLGQPVDYLVFNGLNDPETPGEIPRVEVVLVEIKTGGSRLSPGEKAIKEAVRSGRVRFETLRLDSSGRLSSED